MFFSEGGDFDTFELPLYYLSTGKYTIPIFTAPYWEATFVFLNAEHGLGRLTVTFREGGGITFNETIGRAQQQWTVDRQMLDPLRAYHNYATYTARYETAGIDAPPQYGDRN